MNVKEMRRNYGEFDNDDNDDDDDDEHNDECDDDDIPIGVRQGASRVSTNAPGVDLEIHFKWKTEILEPHNKVSQGTK